jgi:hypothetical protein
MVGSGQVNSGWVNFYEYGHGNIYSCLGQPLPDSQDWDQVSLEFRPTFMHGQVTFSMVGSTLVLCPFGSSHGRVTFSMVRSTSDQLLAWPCGTPPDLLQSTPLIYLPKAAI